MRDRLRALAAGLQTMVIPPPAPDRATHLPTDLPAAIGSLYSLAGDTDPAIAAYQTVIDHMDRTVPYYHLGEITAARCLPALYDRKGEHEKAIAVYQRVIQKDPGKWDWYIALANEYDAIGQKEKALALRRKWYPSGLLRGKPAPEFAMTDLAGRPVDMTKLRGRVVVLFFWFSPYPRQAEIARQLETLQRQYVSRGLTVICLVRGVDQRAAAAQIGKNHSYPVLLGADAIYQRYGVRDSSMLDIVDRQGKLVQEYLGYGMDPGEERWLEQETRKLLGLEVAMH